MRQSPRAAMLVWPRQQDVTPKEPSMSTHQITEGSVVVGVDGSASSDSALRWAMAEAQRTRQPLHVVHALETEPVLTDKQQLVTKEAPARSAPVLTAAIDLVQTTAPELDTTAHSVCLRRIDVKQPHRRPHLVVGAAGGRQPRRALDRRLDRDRQPGGEPDLRASGWLFGQVSGCSSAQPRRPR